MRNLGRIKTDLIGARMRLRTLELRKHKCQSEVKKLEQELAMHNNQN